MNTQNYKNHPRFVPMYHFFTLLASTILVFGTIVNFVKSYETNLYTASLLVFGAIILMLTAFYARVFALNPIGIFATSCQASPAAIGADA